MIAISKHTISQVGWMNQNAIAPRNDCYQQAYPFISEMNQNAIL
jgi:hypothetical protein